MDQRERKVYMFNVSESVCVYVLSITGEEYYKLFNLVQVSIIARYHCCRV